MFKKLKRAKSFISRRKHKDEIQELSETSHLRRQNSVITANKPQNNITQDCTSNKKQTQDYYETLEKLRTFKLEENKIMQDVNINKIDNTSKNAVIMRKNYLRQDRPASTSFVYGRNRLETDM